MDTKQLAMEKHRQWKGKIEVISRAPVTNREELSVAYTPGVAEPCLAIQKDPALSYDLTRRGNLVAVITDGTAVLGLGDIGPEAAMPVMEGKCALFKAFAGVDAFPICVDSKDPETFINTVALISKSFGGINLEDIAAPRCFEIEAELKKRCDIPVFHDDQHGTAIVLGAALLNAAKVVGKPMESLHLVINGAGAAGTSIAPPAAAAGGGGHRALRQAGRALPRRGLDEPGSGPAGRDHQQGKQAGYPGRRNEGRGRVHWRVPPRPGHPGDGGFHGSRRDRVPHGQPGA